MPRILFLGDFAVNAEGSWTPSRDVAALLRNQGWRVSTVSKARSAPWKVLQMAAGAATFPLEIAHIDVYSGRAFWWAAVTAAILRIRRVPYVATLHGGGLPDFGNQHAGQLRRLLAGAARVTSPSAYLREACLRFRPEIEVIPNSVDLSRHSPIERTSLDARLMWIRAYHQVYEPLMAVETFAHVKRAVPSASLTMIGPDKGDSTLQRVVARVDALGLQSSVTIEGRVAKQRVPLALAQGSIFLNTSTIDNSPVTVLEAMASGLCVVSTDVGGIRHLIEHERNGLLVASGNAGQMAEAVLRLLREPALASTMIQAGLATARMHDQDLVGRLWTRLFQGVIGQAS